MEQWTWVAHEFIVRGGIKTCRICGQIEETVIEFNKHGGSGYDVVLKKGNNNSKHKVFNDHFSPYSNDFYDTAPYSHLTESELATRIYHLNRMGTIDEEWRREEIGHLTKLLKDKKEVS